MKHLDECELVSDCNILKGMVKDRDKFYNLYHELSREFRDYEMTAQKRVDRLLEEHKLLMTLCIRYEEENNKLKTKLKSFE